MSLFVIFLAELTLLAITKLHDQDEDSDTVEMEVEDIAVLDGDYRAHFTVGEGPKSVTENVILGDQKKDLSSTDDIIFDVDEPEIFDPNITIKEILARYPKIDTTTTDVDNRDQLLQYAFIASCYSHARYKLKSFVQHFGNASEGHYTTVVKDYWENKWTRFNDSTVIPVCETSPQLIEQENVSPVSDSKKSCYILFYVLGPCWPKSQRFSITSVCFLCNETNSLASSSNKTGTWQTDGGNAYFQEVVNVYPISFFESASKYTCPFMTLHVLE